MSKNVLSILESRIDVKIRADPSIALETGERGNSAG
jgi:hypothetical protein